jgi:hypothetical protein
MSANTREVVDSQSLADQQFDYEDRFRCVADPLVQIQVVGCQCILISSAFATRYGAPGDGLRAAVVNFAAVRSSRFNTVQQPVESRGVKTKDLQGGSPGREPGPEPDSRAY